MEKKQPNLNEILNSPQAAQLLKNQQALDSLLHSDEAQKIIALLNQSSGNGLDQAARSAANGDPAQLMAMVNSLMKDPRSTKLLDDFSKKVPK